MSYRYMLPDLRNYIETFVMHKCSISDMRDVAGFMVVELEVSTYRKSMPHIIIRDMY